jgi:hypothetical protein
MSFMDLRSVLLEIHAALEEAGVDHALIGGLALAAHGAARATVDLDLLADGRRAEDVDVLMRRHGFEPLHRTEFVANYASDDASRGRVDYLFAVRERGRAILARATGHEILGATLRVVTAEDLVGLKVQASSNDPSRRFQDMADVERLLRKPAIDLERVREYFRLFDREKELDAMLERGERR